MPSATARSRNTVLEVRYVLAVLRDATRTLRSRLWTVVEFFTLMVHPNVRSDMLFPGDRALFWWQLQRFILRPFARRGRRS